MIYFLAERNFNEQNLHFLRAAFESDTRLGSNEPRSFADVIPHLGQSISSPNIRRFGISSFTKRLDYFKFTLKTFLVWFCTSIKKKFNESYKKKIKVF